MVFCVGLTGGIASGKSTVAELFFDLGIQIINADKISKELTAKDQLAYQEIVSRYSTEILDNDQELNRRGLRTIIFSDPKERHWLEQLLHPLIRQKIKETVAASATSYCMVEIPLLIEKKNYPFINRILLIDASDEIRITRIMHRDQCNKEQALAILTSQPNIKLRLKEADDLLINDLGYLELKTAVSKLHQKYLQFSMM